MSRAVEAEGVQKPENHGEKAGKMAKIYQE
jgi:hypothetical protein